MAVIDVQGARFGYDEAGEGPAVLLVHGALGDRRMWDHQFHALSAQHRVIRYDWRGYGESSDPADEVAHFEDLLAVMDALEIPEAALVGCSFGGAHCLEATLHAPERVSALALVCSGLTDMTRSEEVTAEIRRRIADVISLERLAAYRTHTAEHIDPADVAAMATMNAEYMVAGPGRDRSALDPAVWEFALQMCREMFARYWSTPAYETRYLNPPASGRLAEVNVPTLVLNGLADATEIQTIADQLTEGIAGARRVDLPDTGHMPSLERPVEVSSALQRFLSGI